MLLDVANSFRTIVWLPPTDSNRDTLLQRQVSYR